MEGGEGKGWKEGKGLTGIGRIERKDRGGEGRMEWRMTLEGWRAWDTDRELAGGKKLRMGGKELGWGNRVKICWGGIWDGGKEELCYRLVGG
jgi:hypothetical protein